MEALTKWVLQETGTLRLRDLKYEKLGGVTGSQPGTFTIKDLLVKSKKNFAPDLYKSYTVIIEEWDNVNKKWLPYAGKDVQVS